MPSSRPGAGALTSRPVGGAGDRIPSSSMVPGSATSRAATSAGAAAAGRPAPRGAALRPPVVGQHLVGQHFAADRTPWATAPRGMRTR